MMNDLLILREKPQTTTLYMLAGWRQWADAGSISSALPKYLIQETNARKIGEIKPNGFYLFQIPGTHHLLRPTVKLQDGYRQSFSAKRNEFYYTGTAESGLLIFLGDEPHMNVEQYAEVFLQAVQELGVKRVVSLGGVYGAMPYDKERQISCLYSLKRMKAELEAYALQFSDYEGGATIGTYLVDQAEPLDIEFLDLYAFVPAYDFAQSLGQPQGISVENDFKAWYDVMRRFNHMTGLGIDLADLQRRSDELIAALDDKIAEVEAEMPQLSVREYMENLDTEFNEQPFMPLDDVWEQGLQDLFDDLDEG
ncbi:MAG: PAC2 family protein [Anaerolineales bacterium]|nr:PAC2 family protein [Anaerolineales bacterium]